MTEISVPTGITLVKREMEITTPAAMDILLGGKKNGIYAAEKLTSAQKKGDKNLLTEHYFVCPFCNAHLPAYGRFFNKQANSLLCTTEEIENFFDEQQSFFDEGNGEKSDYILLSKVLTDASKLKCFHCDKEFKVTDKQRKCAISTENNILEISCELYGFDDIMAVKWNKEKNFDLTAGVLTESIAFDFTQRKVYFKLENKSEILSEKEVSVTDVENKNDPCLILFENHLSCSTIADAFYKLYKYEKPVGAHYNSVAQLILMTKFQGFEKSFYDAVPYRCDDGECTFDLDETFEEPAKYLYDISGVELLLKKSLLPKAKSFRRIIFNSPQLLFYVRELELLWDIMGDVNYFVRFLESKNLYITLSQLHMFSMRNVCEFLRMLKSEKGVNAVLGLLKNSTYVLKKAISAYNLLSDFEKAKCREKIKTQQHFLSRFSFEDQLNMSYSFPVVCPDKDIPDGYVGGYVFKWLRSKADYDRAANALNNCLSGYAQSLSYVAVMMKGDEMYAAVEVSEGVYVDNYRAEQALLKDDKPIEFNSKEGRALREWCKKYDIHIDSEVFP